MERAPWNRFYRPRRRRTGIFNSAGRHERREPRGVLSLFEPRSRRARHADSRIQAAARLFNSQQPGKRHLSVRLVLPVSFRALGVDSTSRKVVLDLERQAELLAVIVEEMERRLRREGEEASDGERGPDQTPRLVRVDLSRRVAKRSASGPSFSASRSSTWPPIMPAVPIASTTAPTTRTLARSYLSRQDRGQSSRVRGSAARRPRESPWPRRRPCGTSARRAAIRHRRAREDRRGSGNTCGSSRGRPPKDRLEIAAAGTRRREREYRAQALAPAKTEWRMAWCRLRGHASAGGSRRPELASMRAPIGAEVRVTPYSSPPESTISDSASDAAEGGSSRAPCDIPAGLLHHDLDAPLDLGEPLPGRRATGRSSSKSASEASRPSSSDSSFSDDRLEARLEGLLEAHGRRFLHRVSPSRSGITSSTASLCGKILPQPPDAARASRIRRRSPARMSRGGGERRSGAPSR